jgi:hypothetical protein
MNTFKIGAAAAGVVKFFTRGRAYRNAAIRRAAKSVWSAIVGTLKVILGSVAVVAWLIALVVAVGSIFASGGTALPFWLVAWLVWDACEKDRARDRAAMQAQIDAMRRH